MTIHFNNNSVAVLNFSVHICHNNIVIALKKWIKNNVNLLNFEHTGY